MTANTVMSVRNTSRSPSLRQTDLRINFNYQVARLVMRIAIARLTRKIVYGELDPCRILPHDGLVRLLVAEAVKVINETTTDDEIREYIIRSISFILRRNAKFMVADILNIVNDDLDDREYGPIVGRIIHAVLTGSCENLPRKWSNEKLKIVDQRLQQLQQKLNNIINNIVD